MANGAARSGHYITAKIANAIVCLLLGIGHIADAEPGFPYVTAEERQKLEETNELSRYFSGNETPDYAPTERIADSVRRDLDELGSNIGVEILRAAGAPAPEEHPTELFNILLSISELKGLEYYSHSRDRMRLLFDESYAINSPESAQPISDPEIADIPAEGRFYVFQKDLTFGENVLAVTYAAEQDGMHLVMENETPYTYGPIRLIRPHRMHLHIYLLLDEDELYYYSVFGAVSINFFLIERKIFNSFSSRLEALYGWYMKQRSPRGKTTR